MAGITVLNCQTEDVGNGIYVGGTNALTEGCRFFKTRDAFIVPVYSQDDTGIQYYGGDGVIRRNLCVGFDKGVFLKSSDGPHLVEHNTLVCTETGVRGDNWGLGNATTTLPDKYRLRLQQLLHRTAGSGAGREVRQRVAARENSFRLVESHHPPRALGHSEASIHLDGSLARL